MNNNLIHKADKEMLKNISSFGERYMDEFLSDYNSDVLLNDWREAFRFFANHIYFQARKDDLSLKVTNRSLEVIERNIKTKGIMDKNFLATVRLELLEVIGRGKIGKGRDIDMTIDCLKFIQEIPENNIFKYSYNKIKDKLLHEHYDELLKLKQIGPKIASFYLRDVVLLSKLTHLLSEADHKDLQPVDTWVRRIAAHLSIIDKDENEKEVRKRIIDVCSQYNIDPLKYNAGTWYLGSHSFDIVMENIGTIKYMNNAHKA